MIVMWHKFDFKVGEQMKTIHSYMVVKGENAQETAMAKTVGLPLGAAVELIVNDKIKATGVRIPISKEIYNPILEVLKTEGIEVREEEVG
jgi:saccharopine dehydrogenase-like NADP-dependent oxidoreductase